MEGLQMLTKKELANAYGIHPQTMSSRLKELGITGKQRIKPKDLEKIYEELGKPKSEGLKS
ncbi:helix-turn-helix domain-containing protein [Alistipes sp. ZOR0009]|uniref:helix-turn-helix domain-containing protein n=1 Tax=Alistipes sp. ZOR0009 TaxID=1339253 RepID=UPI00064900D1|nr:helix-turn-helix domain-containing protein [Alistipes sp. ZOR0009]